MVEDVLNEPIEIYKMQKIEGLLGAHGKSGNKAVDINGNVSAKRTAQPGWEN
jgi:hypothetical protein